MPTFNVSLLITLFVKITKAFPLAKETLINLFQNGIKKGLLNSIPDMDAESIKVTSKIFACFAQIVSIMPVSNYQDIDSTFLSGLYVFATFGSVNPSYHSASLGIDAMSCVNELISKTAVFNSEANEFIYNVFQNIFIILQRVMNGSPRTSPANLNGCEDGPVSTNFKDVDEVYLTKFITFLKLFVAGHLARFEKLIDFSTKELLAAMLELTTKMQQHSIECYFQLLEIWTIYFEYLQNSLQVKHKENNTISPEKLQSIKETIFELLIYLLRSIQFSINADFLAQLDDRTPDDDGRTELEHFMYRTIEVIANIGEVYPHETVHYIDANCFHDKLRNLQYGLEFYAGHNGEQWPVRYKNGHASKLMPMEILRHHPLGQLQVNLLDFITTLQVCSRFSNFFVQESFDSYFVLTKAIFDKLFAILQFVNIQHLCDIASSHTSKGGRGTRSQHPLLREFVLLKAQIIATFKAYIVWFQQFCFIRNTDANANETSTTSKSYANQEQFNPEAEHYLTVIFDTCCSIVSDATILERNINDDEDVCEAISTLYHSASLTLSTFSLNVRPAFVFALPSVQRLIEVDSLDRLLQLGKDSGKVLVPLSDQILLSQSITNLLVLPWFMVSNEAQDWDKRSERLSALIGYYLQLFNRLNLESSVGSTKVSKLPPNDYCRSLYILRKMIKSHADSPAKSKQMLLLPLSTSLEAFTQLLQTNSLLHTTVAGCQITEHILALFNVVFDVLLGQISIDLVRRTMQALLQIIAWHDILNGKGRQANFKAIDIQSALKVIIKFMKLLTLIVKQTSVNNSLRSLLPEIINFTAANIQTNLICMKTSSIGAALVNDRSSNYDVYAKLLKVYYQFYYELLLNNNRYFFPKSSLAPLKQLTTTSNATTSTPGEEQKRQYFERIMEIFGQSFEMVCNIQLYQQNVESLESLNKTVRLYTREAFKGAFLQRFLYMFVKALLDGTVPLLEESILEIVFHLAEVDFVHFYDIFLPEFVSNIPILSVERRVSLVERAACGLRDPNTGVRLASTDLPTFSSHLNQLLSDLRLYIKFAAIPHHLF